MQINNTKNHNSIRKDPKAWDIWVSANVNAGLGDPQNFFENHNSIRKDPKAWDIWVSANVNAGLGDPQNFFDTYCLDSSIKNSGGHHSDDLEMLAVQLRGAFDPGERAKIAVKMQQELLDDNSYFFCSFLRMSMIMQANVTGLAAHTCDYGRIIGLSACGDFL